MILYTIVPHELIFEAEQEFSNNQENFYYKGIFVTVERMGLNRYKVVSLLSTNPKDYLIDEIQPGKMIEIPLFQGIHS